MSECSSSAITPRSASAGAFEFGLIAMAVCSPLSAKFTVPLPPRIAPKSKKTPDPGGLKYHLDRIDLFFQVAGMADRQPQRERRMASHAARDLKP
jgi:hypothetical protein